VAYQNRPRPLPRHFIFHQSPYHSKLQSKLLTSYIIEGFRRGHVACFLPKTLKMGQTNVPETLVAHQKLTPGYNPKTFKLLQSCLHAAYVNTNLCTFRVCYTDWEWQKSVTFISEPRSETIIHSQGSEHNKNAAKEYFFGAPPRKAAVCAPWRVHPNIVTSHVITKGRVEHSVSDNNRQSELPTARYKIQL
jgi:hypothetical protein